MKGLYPVKTLKFLNQSYFVLEVEAPPMAKEAEPGMFCQILVREPSLPMLRIPISIYQVDGKYVQFMVKIVGNGTDLLSKLGKGDLVDIMGPMGNSFQHTNRNHVLLISGGVGYPPLSFLKERMSAGNIYWIHGGHCWEDTFPCDKIYTEDGSAGIPGLVTTGMKRYLQHHDVEQIYACGPRGMLAACVKIAKAHHIPIQVSMEEYMGCGIGVCYGCVIRMVQRNPEDPMYKRVCADGPIFDGYEVKWDE